MKLKYSFFFVIILLFVECNYSAKKLQNWVADKDNGLIQEVENDNFVIEVQYKPQNLMVAMENRKEDFSKEEFDKQLGEKEELQYFNIKLISKTGKPVLKTNVANEQEEDLRLQYYIGAFEYDIYLADGNDTLPCLLYHFERTYGAVNFNNISVAFENTNKNTENKTLLIADRALGFNLEQFIFKKEDINNVPKLKIN